MGGNNRSGRYSGGALTEVASEGQLLREVDEAFASLHERYLGADPGFHASYRIDLDDLGLSWAVELDERRCTVTVSPERDPDTVIGTDAATWLELREGRLSGLDAFRSRRLWARGNLDLAVAFEGFFQRPYGRPPLLRIHEVRAGKARISTLTAGDGIETVILIHGLGSNKTSFYETVSALTPHHTVHAIDLPGFGSSSKPLRAPYDAPWFARSVTRFMDAMGIERAHVVGNSLGGRVAIEVGLREPGRVQSLSLLCPSMAWRRRRHFVPLVKLLRPEPMVSVETRWRRTLTSWTRWRGSRPLGRRKRPSKATARSRFPRAARRRWEKASIPASSPSRSSSQVVASVAIVTSGRRRVPPRRTRAPCSVARTSQVCPTSARRMWNVASKPGSAPR